MKRTLLAVVSLLPVLLMAQNGTSTNPASNAESPEHRAARLKWFQEARFGMFIHWGVYAVPAGEWNGKPVGSCGEWILKLGQIPIADYKAFAPQFTASKYDPKAWAALAKEAGAKYVVITSKHHDGFSLYDSAASDWNAVKASGAKRDLLAPLAEAVRAEGLKFGLYYSQAQDWVHRGGGLHYGGKEGEPGWDPSHGGSFDDYLKSVALPQVREILTRYKPSVIWWDTPAYMTAERARPFAEALRELAPEIVSNNRLGGGFGGDTITPEQHIPPRGYPGKMFEVCMTMNHTWGFKKDDQNWKSARELIRNLSDISNKGGNFLLNVGPTAEGEIPQASIDRLKAMGRWMAINGQAIYATEANPFPRRLTWGRCTQKKEGQGGTTLYLHVWEWPQEGKILLPTRDVPVESHLLQGGAPVTSRATDDGLEVSLPGSAPDADVSVVALHFAGSLTITQEAFMSPGKDGVYTFQALDADNYGSIFGNFELVGHGAETYLSKWRDAGWYLEYSLKTSAVSKWRVSAEIAAEKPVALKIVPGNKGAVPVTAEIPATGKPGAWQPVELGTITLPAGETSFSLKPVQERWSTIHVRRVWLKPAPELHGTDVVHPQ